MNQVGPEVSETIKSYDRTARDFALKNYAIDMAEQQQRFLALLPEAAQPQLLLDLGCGPGRDTLAFAQQGYEVVGADLSAGMLAEAQQRVPHGRFVQADMGRLPFAAAGFSGLWACASLLHLPRLAAAPALAEMHRVLQPGGALFLGVQRGKDAGWQRDEAGNARFFTYYQPSQFWKLVLDAGFEPQALAENTSERRRPDGSPVRWINLYARKA